MGESHSDPVACVVVAGEGLVEVLAGGVELAGCPAQRAQLHQSVRSSASGPQDGVQVQGSVQSSPCRLVICCHSPKRAEVGVCLCLSGASRVPAVDVSGPGSSPESPGCRQTFAGGYTPARLMQPRQLSGAQHTRQRRTLPPRVA